LRCSRWPLRTREDARTSAEKIGRLQIKPRDHEGSARTFLHDIDLAGGAAGGSGAERRTTGTSAVYRPRYRALPEDGAPLPWPVVLGADVDAPGAPPVWDEGVFIA
jgi:hypothetical protein